MSIDEYEIKFESEEDCKMKLKYMVENQKNLFQLIVMDDDDISYVPKFDFNFDIIDCSKMELKDKVVWDEIVGSDKTIVFKNTSDLFKQFKDYRQFNTSFESGSGAFSQMFYFIYRDYFWNESDTKLIFIVTEEDALSMYREVNPGMNILLYPIYLRKKCNSKDGEKSFRKSFKK